MHGEPVGSLLRDSDGCSFAYDLDAVERLGGERARLSTTMAPRAEPYGPAVTRPYLEGLLPQGRRRLKLARELGLEVGDAYGMLAALGRDCPGAVVFLPEGERVADPVPPADLAWLDDEELEDVVRTPLPRIARRGRREHPQRMRFVLPGRRHKLALVRDEAGDRWAWPAPGAPSTHVVKPEPLHRPGAAALEAACTQACRSAGLMVAHAELAEIGGVDCLVSTRFDRWQAGGSVERLHQESLTQALGIAPGDSEGRLVPGVPTLAEAAGLLRAHGDEAGVEALLTAAICDLAVGHIEPRPAGAALLYSDGEPALAPFFDLVGTELYGEERVRPRVIGEDVPPAPLLIDIVHAIQLCGFEEQPWIVDSPKLMMFLAEGLGRAAERAQEEDWYHQAIDEALRLMLERMATYLRRELKYVAPRGADLPPWME
jgi:serine/threonine-protein kinase HipA